MASRRRAILKKSVQPVDVTRGAGIGDLVDQFRSSSIQARNLGRCLEVWENALTDRKRPTILLGLAGPLIAAGLRKVIRDLVDWGLVDVVVSTGAVMYQDLYQTIGGRHWMGTPTADDVQLRSLYLDRIYDTYVDELKFEDTDRAIGKITEQFPRRPASSREYLQFLGERFDDPNSI
ncbi:Deoxyhypusine synthase, partial [mine drainage metagenome]